MFVLGGMGCERYAVALVSRKVAAVDVDSSYLILLASIRCGHVVTRRKGLVIWILQKKLIFLRR